MQLSKLITWLKSKPVNLVIPRGLGFGEPMSYRGYYDQVAFAPIGTETTIGAMLEHAKSAMGATFTGYKGGEFTMTGSTECWIADYGETVEYPITEADLIRMVGGDSADHLHEEIARLRDALNASRVSDAESLALYRSALNRAEKAEVECTELRAALYQMKSEREVILRAMVDVTHRDEKTEADVEFAVEALKVWERVSDIATQEHNRLRAELVRMKSEYLPIARETVRLALQQGWDSDAGRQLDDALRAHADGVK